MFVIDPNSFYTRKDLAELLAPAGVDVDSFTARLKARKVFRAFWKGSDLLKAYDAAPELAERAGEAAMLPEPANPGNRKRRGRVRADTNGMRYLDALRDELRRKE